MTIKLVSVTVIPAQPGWVIAWGPGEAAENAKTEPIIAWEIQPRTDDDGERQVVPITVYGREHPRHEQIRHLRDGSFLGGG